MLQRVRTIQRDGHRKVVHAGFPLASTMGTVFDAYPDSPSLSMNLLAGLDPRLTFTRASSAWTFDGGLNFVEMTTNQPRIWFDPASGSLWGLMQEPQSTNNIRNPRYERATVGVIGSGGVMPSYTFIGNPAGLTYEIESVSTVSGLPVMRLHMSGTPTSTTNVQIQLEAATQIAAASGQAWAYGQYLRLAAGSWNNVTVLQSVIVERSGTGAFLASTVLNQSFPTSDVLRNQRFFATRTLTNASTAYVAPAFNIQVVSGNAVDLTLDIGPGQLEQIISSTSQILPPVGSPAASTRAADILSMPVADFPFNPNAGTLVTEQILMQDPSTAVGRVVTIDDGTNSNKIQLSVNQNGTLQAALVVGGTSVTTPTAGTVPVGTVSKFGYAYQNNDQSLVLDAGSPALKNGQMPSGLTTFRLGRDSGGNTLSACWRSVKMFPYRMPDAAIQTQTSL